MMEIHNIMPEKEYDQFTEQGCFTIRRSDKFWDGVFSDQTIDQFLMRLLKTSGGMAGGRGITDSTLTRWVHALPQCVPICNALETFTSVIREHLNKIQISVHPVSPGANLILIVLCILFSVTTGIVEDMSVYCDNALQIGQCSMKKMIGKSYSELTLHRKDKVKLLAAMNNTIKINREDTVIYPSLLFNRITCILNTSIEMETFLQYELAPQPHLSFYMDKYGKQKRVLWGE